MRKSESIIRMEALGLNTLDYFISTDKQEVLHYLAKHANDKMSLRTERGDEFLCPFYYMIPGELLIPIAIKHLGEKYTLILAPSLDIKGCLAFGSIALGEQEADVIEYVKGEGKVRELYKHPEAKHIILSDRSMVAVKEKDHPGMALILNTIYKELKDKCYDEIPCCIEWSYYQQPIGVKHQQLIVWEVREYV